MKPFTRKSAVGPSILHESNLGLCLLALLLFLAFGTVTESFAIVRWAALLFLLATLGARAWRLVPCAILIFYLYVGVLVLPAAVWNVPAALFLIPFFATWLTCWPFAPLRAQFHWLKRGEPGQITWLLVALVSLASAVALVLWALWSNYLGIAVSMMHSFRNVPFWFLLLIGIPGFALVNAFAEEVVYRGVIQSALEQRFAEKPWLSLGGQAFAFAAAHYSVGFPNGKMGFLMTFVYACLLGFLKLRSLGLLAPYVAHVAADLVIGITLLLLAR